MVFHIADFMTFLAPQFLSFGSKNRKLLEMDFFFTFPYLFEELANNKFGEENIWNSWIDGFKLTKLYAEKRGKMSARISACALWALRKSAAC